MPEVPFAGANKQAECIAGGRQICGTHFPLDGDCTVVLSLRLALAATQTMEVGAACLACAIAAKAQAQKQAGWVPWGAQDLLLQQHQALCLMKDQKLATPGDG